jgi:hypothetical protein
MPVWTKPVIAFLVSYATVLAGPVLGNATSADGNSDPDPRPGLTALTLDQQIKTGVKPSWVETNFGKLQLVDMRSIRFQLDERSHLTAKIETIITMAKGVDYQVHGAVFAENGQLLGTAKTPCRTGIVSTISLMGTKLDSAILTK